MISRETITVKNVVFDINMTCFLFVQGEMKIYSTGFIDGVLTFVNISPQVGSFTPTLLIYFPQLSELDISGCKGIDQSLFTDCIGACSHLKKLVMTGCIQFQQYHIVRFASTVKKINYLDAENCGEFTYANAYAILATLQDLRMLHLNPQDIGEQLQKWSNLFVLFRRVHFGINITRHFPFNGNYLRVEMPDE